MDYIPAEGKVGWTHRLPFAQWPGRQQQQSAVWTCSGFDVFVTLGPGEWLFPRSVNYFLKGGGGTSRAGKCIFHWYWAKWHEDITPPLHPHQILKIWATRPAAWAELHGQTVVHPLHFAGSQMGRKELQGHFPLCPAWPASSFPQGRLRCNHHLEGHLQVSQHRCQGKVKHSC